MIDPAEVTAECEAMYTGRGYRKYSRRAVRKVMLNSVVAILRREAQFDTIDQDLIDQISLEQHRLADRLEREARNL